MSDLNFSTATANGRAAIATIIVYGDEALSLATNVFQPRNRKINLSDSMGRAVYGNWIADGKPGEDLIVCPVAANRFEIHCHGSVAAIDIICQTLLKQGARQVHAKDLACWLTGSQYFADMLLATTLASTAKTTKLMLKQKDLHRKFWRTIKKLMDDDQERLAISVLDDFLAYEQFGLSLTKPFTVVFCGSPNVGKSSLVNAILGFNRTIVHDSAGTTRDAVSEETVIDGWPMILTDTAGIRESSDQIEKQGIRIAHSSIANADLKVLLVDLSKETDYSIKHQIAAIEPDLVVGNQLDLAQSDFEHVALRVSATQRTNIEQLMSCLVENLIPDCPPDSQAYPVTPYQVQLIKTIRKAINEADYETVTKSIQAILGE